MSTVQYNWERTQGTPTPTEHATINPWSLPGVIKYAGNMAAQGWKPIRDPDDAGALGVTAGWFYLYRQRVITATALHGNGTVVLVHPDTEVALWVEVVTGSVQAHETVEAALNSVRCVNVGLRALYAPLVYDRLVTEVARVHGRAMAQQWRHLVTDAAWVQVPYFDVHGHVKMYQEKVKTIMTLERPKRAKKRPQVVLESLDRRDKWRKRPQPVDVEVHPDGTSLIMGGTRAYNWTVNGEYAYLTQIGGISRVPEYRIDHAQMRALLGEQYNVTETA